MEVPPELPRPLKVAQAVVARHPGTRSLHDGIILTIKSSKYRVQFNRWGRADVVWLMLLQLQFSVLQLASWEPFFV
jgi:hypothetical protein